MLFIYKKNTFMQRLEHMKNWEVCLAHPNKTADIENFGVYKVLLLVTRV